MEPLDHSEQLELLAGYVLGDLNPVEAAQVKQLLEQNPDLQTDLDRLQATLAVLPLSLPLSAPSPQLETWLLQAAQGENASAINSTSEPKGWVRSWTWKWGIAIAAVMIAGFGIETYRLHHQLAAVQLENHQLHQQLVTTQAALDQIRQRELATTRQELSRYQETVNLLRQPNNRFLRLLGTNPKLQSSGSLVIVPTKEAAILVLRDVAPLPEGKVYRLWALVEGQKVGCGDFKPNAQGDVMLQLPLNQLGRTTEVVVTIEPDRALPMPVGEMVITGS